LFSTLTSFFFIAALRFANQIIQRAFKLGNALMYEVKVDGGGFYGGMSQEFLDGKYIHSMGQ
jgi:hypothetical protein